MTVGDPSVFAIESGITKAYERLTFRALGFFVIHVAGRRYGVYAPAATMLACSFDEVGRRVGRRGKHIVPFPADSDAGEIADAFRSAVYGEEPDARYLGIPTDEFRRLFYPESSSLMWAPDGDEAFDDGSFVLHFDVQDRVRLIAFRSSEDYLHNPGTLRDVWLPADEFYGVQNDWHVIQREWATMPKEADYKTSTG